MGKNLDFREDLDLDIFNAVDVILSKEQSNEGILYVRVDFDTKHTRLAAAGDSDALFTGVLAILENVEGAFAIFLDAVLTYADEKKIDIDTFFEAPKPIKKRGRPKKK